jgi:hypothetical protein
LGYDGGLGREIVLTDSANDRFPLVSLRGCARLYDAIRWCELQQQFD